VKKGLLSLVAAVVGALAFAGVATAGAPTTVSFDVNRTRVIPASITGCGFDVVRHVQGTYYVTTFYNSDGSFAREVDRVSNFTVTETNPLTGRSLTSVLAGPFIVEPYGPGTVKVTIPGNDGHLTAPGQGVIWSNVGLLVYIADAADPFTPVEILSVSGLYTGLDGPYPEACAALA
jgi:hypothetical protein